jgi:hypothetical protein
VSVTTARRDEGDVPGLTQHPLAAVRIRAQTPTRISCPSCGRVRDVSLRQARRIESDRDPASARCKECRFGRTIPRALPDDADRQFWLSRFDDEAILLFAWSLTREHGSRENVAGWRRKLGIPLPAGGKGKVAA